MRPILNKSPPVSAVETTVLPLSNETFILKFIFKKQQESSIKKTLFVYILRYVPLCVIKEVSKLKLMFVTDRICMAYYIILKYEKR